MTIPERNPDPTRSGALVAREFVASLVVFLVALPLCMGLAIASGVPASLGILTGVIGGLVVGLFSGSPLGVSGPAAGLVVLVWQIVDRYGLAGLGPAVLVVGAVQVAGATLGAGRWFRATSPAVIHGMLAGIGVLIVASQLHVMLDGTPHGEGLENLAALPAALVDAAAGVDGPGPLQAGVLGLIALCCLITWDRYRPTALAAVPGALLGVVAATVAAIAIDAQVIRVNLPENLDDDITFLWRADLTLLTDPAFLTIALTMAAIASAESLLCAAAVDRMHDGPRTRWNRELGAQGVGNALCGLIGALPMTAVVVRSSVNVQAGARTRYASVLHGAWLLLLVVGLPSLLRLIPQGSLAAILVVTGARLVDTRAMRHYWRTARPELGIYVLTMLGVVTLDLLLGVVIGLVLTAARALWGLSRVAIHETQTPEGLEVSLSGAGTFLSIPTVADRLDGLPYDRPVHLSLDLRFLDHAFLEHIEEWVKVRRARGHGVEVDLDALHARFDRRDDLGPPRAA